MFSGSDLIKLALKEARFFLVTEILNVRWIQQKGDLSLLALTMKGHGERNCGWSQGAGWLHADSQQRFRDLNLTTLRITFYSKHMNLHKVSKL